MPGHLPTRIVATEAERSTAWINGTHVFCQDTKKEYVLDGGQFYLVGPSGGGSDPWTYLKLASDFTTSLATAQDVTGLAFTPAANLSYEFEACLMLRTATATVQPRIGLAFPTGLTDGVASAFLAQSATAQLTAFGNINAALLMAVGGLANNTQSWPGGIRGLIRAGASPSGNVKVQLASETAGTVVRVVAGSFLKYRQIP